MGFKDFVIFEAGLEHRAFNKFKKLEEIRNLLMQQGYSESDIWVTYSEVPRITIWGGSADKAQGTPHALFAYPITKILERKDTFGEYATDRPYIVVFIANEKINDIGGANADFKIRNRFKAAETPEVVRSVYKNIDKSIKSNPYFNLISKKFGSYWYIDFSSIDDDEIKYKSKDTLRHVIEENLDEVMDLRGSDTILGDEIPYVYRHYKDYHNSQSIQLFSDTYLNVSLSLEAFDKILNIPEFDYISQYGRTLLPLDVLLRFDSQIRKDGIPKISEVIKRLRQDEPEITKIIQMLFDNCVKKQKNINKLRISKAFGKDFPNKKKLLQFAQNHGLDVVRAFKNMQTSGNKIENDSQVIYRFTEQLAMQWAEKDGKYRYYPSRWTRILKAIGYTNIADLRNTGAVHVAESTQGAFFDTRKLEMVGLVRNKSHNDYRFYQSPSFISGGREQRKSGSPNNYFSSPQEKEAEARQYNTKSRFVDLKNALSRVERSLDFGVSVSSEYVEYLKKAFSSFKKVLNWAQNQSSWGYDLYSLKRLISQIEFKNNSEAIKPLLDNIKSTIDTAYENTM
jgi:hypothetical protein